MSLVTADGFGTELESSYPFLSELMAMRRRARSHISGGEARAIVQLLNEALLSELTCLARYRGHARLGSTVDQVREEFLRYARDEQGHAHLLAERILQLGGQPPASVPSATSSTPHAQVDEELDAEAVIELLEEDLIAERIAIDCYREIMQFIGERDASTRELLQTILTVEIDHARELAAIRTELMRRDRAAGTSLRLPRLDLQCA